MQQKTAGKFLECKVTCNNTAVFTRRRSTRRGRPDARCSMIRGGQLVLAELQPTAGKMYMYDRN